MKSLSFLCLSCAVFTASAQDLSGILSGASRQLEKNAKVTGVRFNCLPAECKVRPLETLIIQVLVDGELASKSGGEPIKGRLHRAPGDMKVLESNGGFISKRFKFQGTDPGNFIDTGGGAFGSILGKVAGDYIVFDTFLYSAPEEAGTYTVENTTEGTKGQLKITVAADAPSSKQAESTTFPAESASTDPYRPLVEHYAPMFAQETWFQPKADVPTRFDYDGDFLGDNNWDNLDKGTSQAYIHYAVMETGTHWFLIYNAWHPRDYSDKCVAGSCHENDNEGLILTVLKDGTQFGQLQVMETLAHDNVYAFTNDNSIRGNAHAIDGKIEFYENSHPIVFVESGGHGIYGSTKKVYSRYDASKDQFTEGTGNTFVYKGVAERPKHANERKVGYELLPILTHWWPRAASDQDQKMFDAFQPYSPSGNRPGIKLPKAGTTFWGRKQAANKAKPFWGWHDNKTLKNGLLAVGQWGLDPAYGIAQSVRLPQQVSTDYIYNPYLGIGDTPPSQPAAAAAPAITITPAAPVVSAPTSGTSILPTTIGTPEQPPAATPTTTLPAITPTAASGWIEIQASVDASVVFHILQGEVTPEVLAGQPVKEQKVQLSGPVPAGVNLVYTLEKKSGRGNIRIEEQPSAQNSQTLKIRVDDSKGGAARYVFRLNWKTQ
ncbi:MAG: hypothetical protein HY820_37535 [Acidobacteria bacterium]|nr:hypothetical protein [Acidobacteriota bacterium]